MRKKIFNRVPRALSVLPMVVASTMGCMRRMLEPDALFILICVKVLKMGARAAGFYKWGARAAGAAGFTLPTVYIKIYSCLKSLT